MHMASLAYKFLERKGYRNMKVLKEGLPGWAQKRYPLQGPRAGAIEHRPYSQAVLDFERRLAGLEPRAANAGHEPGNE